MDIRKIDAPLFQQASDTVKMLSIDMVEQAKSGHPGLPMELSGLTLELWLGHLTFNPKNPDWLNRDRFILSAGHGSALLYSLLHLFGYSLPIDELKRFRQLGSKTPGHPEYGHTVGVETTTGPLGQGFANAVGMALSEQALAARINTVDYKIIDHYTYCIASDGDMMEGVSGEAASFAGHLGLSKLICIYTSNSITIEGGTDLAFSEDVGKRFEAYNWQVLTVDAYENGAVYDAISQAKKETRGPTLIIAQTTIGKGSPNKEGTAKAHGEPLGEKEALLTKQNHSWPTDSTFYVPQETKDLCALRASELEVSYNEWNTAFDKMKAYEPESASFLDRMLKKEVPPNIFEHLTSAVPQSVGATRSFSGKMMQHIANCVPSLIGGSADLAPSTKTNISESTSIANGDYRGKNIHFGVREHAMAGILNGMALYGGFIPYGSTFLIFSDYMKPSIRLAALMKIQVIYLFTHDSIFVGEDGPTHEPVEQLASLRLIPNLKVIRPCDTAETAAAWMVALNNKTGPTALICTRQNVVPVDRNTHASADNLTLGAYVLKNCTKEPDIIIGATGSEVELALRASEELEKKGVNVRVVSIPCVELFDAQSEEYKKEVFFQSKSKIVIIEAGSSMCWYRFCGKDGLIIGVDRFGQSAPSAKLAVEYELTVESVLSRIQGKWNM